jgi:hypothetical protein
MSGEVDVLIIGTELPAPVPRGSQLLALVARWLPIRMSDVIGAANLGAQKIEGLCLVTDGAVSYSAFYRNGRCLLSRPVE